VTGDATISTTISIFLLIGAGTTIAMLYNGSRERQRLLVVMGATVLACYSLAILLITHLHL
jgi:hypothetical protein